MRRPAYAAAMWTELPGSYALPEDPMLADAAASLRDTGHWGFVVDDQRNLVYVTDELRLTYITLSDLPTATEKARRDAPAIAVCDV